jgi:hypothetical protein
MQSKNLDVSALAWLVLLYLGHHLSFLNKKILEAMTPLMMPFVQGILHGMHLLILKETQEVCH